MLFRSPYHRPQYRAAHHVRDEVPPRRDAQRTDAGGPRVEQDFVPGRVGKVLPLGHHRIRRRDSESRGGVRRRERALGIAVAGDTRRSGCIEDRPVAVDQGFGPLGRQLREGDGVEVRAEWASLRMKELGRASCRERV